MTADDIARLIASLRKTTEAGRARHLSKADRLAIADALEAAEAARAVAEAGTDEALNQLDSERHSVAVLERRVAEKMNALASAEAEP